jgi:hypothetical protein
VLLNVLREIQPIRHYLPQFDVRIIDVRTIGEQPVAQLAIRWAS